MPEPSGKFPYGAPEWATLLCFGTACPAQLPQQPSWPRILFRTASRLSFKQIINMNFQESEFTDGHLKGEIFIFPPRKYNITKERKRTLL